MKIDEKRFNDLTKDMDSKELDKMFTFLADLFEDGRPAVKMMSTSHKLLNQIQEDLDKITDIEKVEDMDIKAKKYTEALCQCIEIIENFEKEEL